MLEFTATLNQEAKNMAERKHSLFLHYKRMGVKVPNAPICTAVGQASAGVAGENAL